MSRVNMVRRRSIARIAVGRARRWYQFHSLAIIVGLASLGISVISTPTASVYFLALGVVSSVIGVVQLVMLAVTDVRRLDDIHGELRNPPLRAAYEALYDSWIETELDGRSAISNPQVDHALRSDAVIRLEKLDRPWRLAKEYEPTRRLLALKLDFDEAKLRLVSDLTPGSDSVTVQRTPYSASQVTNLLGEVALADRSVTEGRGGHNSELLSHEAVILRDGHIPTLARSGCSNHVGVGILAVTADGYLVFTKQSNRNATSHNLWVPSGSGSMDWADLAAHSGATGVGDLVGLVKTAMWREMTEELGLRGRAGAPTTADIRVLRYARVTHWGGKPEFYGVARIQTADFAVRGVEKRYLRGYVVKSFDTGQGPDGLISAISGVLANDKPKLSFPLAYCLIAVRDWLANDSSAWQWLSSYMRSS